MGNRLSTRDFIERAISIHRGKYDYSCTEYNGSESKVEIICNHCGSHFFQTARTHLEGHGCNVCYGADGRVWDKNSFVEKARSVHGNVYNYDDVDYKNAITKVKIICSQHGAFLQTPNAHLNGHGCPECKKQSIRTKNGISKDEFIERAKKKHGNKYDYSKVEYVNGNTKVCIGCKKNGDFWQNASSHLCGSGCPSCKKSKGENSISIILDEYGVKYERQCKIPSQSVLCKNSYMIVDFFLPQLNTIIEYNGEQHYMNVPIFSARSFEQQVERDFSLRMYCKLNKIRLIEIPYTEIKKVKQILKQNKII